jgi:hypothetical protein
MSLRQAIDGPTPAASIPSSAFTLFSQLEPELRLKIWSCNFPGPRKVRVHYDAEARRFHTSTPSPINLLICIESRVEAMKVYQLHFGTLRHAPSIRADLRTETVEMDWDAFRILCGPCGAFEFHSIRFLEVSGKALQDFMDFGRHRGPLRDVPAAAVAQHLQFFTVLKEFTIVSPPPDRPSPGLPYPPEMVFLNLAYHLAFTKRHRHAISNSRLIAHSMLERLSKFPEWRTPLLYLILIKEDGTSSERVNIELKEKWK